MKEHLLKAAVGLLDLLAGPYRVIACKYAAPGFIAWTGIVVAAPLFVCLDLLWGFDRDREALVTRAWLALLLLGFVQTVAAWRWRGSPRFWFARGEELFLFSLVAGLWHYASYGLAAFFFTGCIANQIRGKLIDLGASPPDDAVTPFRLFAVPLRFFAGPYRALAYKFGTFGGKRAGTVTWLGILLAYPVVFEMKPHAFPESMDYFQYLYIQKWKFFAGWIILGVAAYVQMMVTWCRTRPRADEGEGHSWVGSWEPFLAGALVFGADKFICPGAAYFMGAGYFSSLSLIGLTRLQRRLDAWSEQDAERVAAVVHAGKARTKTAGSIAASKVAAASMLAGGFALRSLNVTWEFLRSLRRQPVEGQPVAYKPPTFSSRVGSHIVGQLVITVLITTGGWKVAVWTAGHALAVPLRIMGWVTTPPSDDAEAKPGIISRIGDSFKDRAQDARDYLHDRRERASEAWDEKREEFSERVHDAREGLGRRYAEEKRELADKAESAVSKGVNRAVWGGFGGN